MMMGQQVVLLNVGILQFLAAAGQTLVVAMAAFAVLCLLVSIFRFQFMTYRAVEAPAEDIPAEDILRFQIMQRLGTAHRTPDPFFVMLMSVAGRDEIAAAHGEDVAAEVVEFVRAEVGSNVRRDDTVCLYEENTVAAIVDATREQSESIIERVIGRVSKSTCRAGSSFSQRPALHVGVASFPENGERVQPLVSEAASALDRAVGGSPNRFVHAAVPAEAGIAAPAREGNVPDQRSLVDPLTGVLRSERLGTAMQKYIARYRKEDLPVSMLYLDIDYLKRYNEHYGKEAGDALLRGVGEVLQRVVREDDLIGRYGGEEFIVVMPCAPSDALIAAQRLTAEIKKTIFPFGQTKLRITMSTGVAGFPDHGTTPRQLFEAAEIALVTAKSRGRGRSIMFEPAMRTEKRRERHADSF